MLKLRILVGLLLTAVLGVATMAPGQSDVKQQVDLISFNRLLTQIRQIDHEYDLTVRKGMREARDHGGKARVESLATLLSLRDRRDRVMARLTLLGLRHGWELPGSSAPGDIRLIAPPSPRQEIFNPADRIIKERFAVEAQRIANALDLPVISLRRMGVPLSPRP